jgi:hypothetical protein
VYEVDALSSVGAKVATLNGGATTTALPATGFPRPFGTASVWNTAVGNAAPAANATNLDAWFRAHVVNPNMTLHAWGVAFAEARPTDPGVPVPCTFYSDCTPGAFGAVPMPATAAPDPATDGQLAVVDPASKREWDLSQARKTGGVSSASAGAALDMTGNAVAPAGTTYGMYLRDQGGLTRDLGREPRRARLRRLGKSRTLGRFDPLAGIPWNRVHVLAPPC